MSSFPPSTRTVLRVRVPHRVARPGSIGSGVVAEVRGEYEAAPSMPAGHGSAGPTADALEVADTPGATAVAGTAAPDPATADRDPPFGLPVLGELPELAAALEAVVAGERRLLEAVATLARVVAWGEVEAATGVSVEHWLGIVARQTRLDRRLLLRLCRLLGRLPRLATAVEAGQVSFAQLRGLGLVLRTAPAEIDAALDELLARLLPELATADPDALIDQLRRAVEELAPRTAPAETAEVGNHLYVQPNLTLTGGRFGGELDAVGLAILDESTTPTRSQLDHPGGTGGARADNLLGRLAHTCDPAPAATPRDQQLATDDADPTHLEPTPSPWPLPPVKLLARVELDTLLDCTRVPAQLLTRLTGGHLKLSTAAARRLLDQRGVELRTIVIDQGRVVGVGRRSRQPPGWLRDGILAVHDTCTGPLCDRPARGADLDHAHPWHPVGSDDLPGTTDAQNLGPLCPATNRDKQRAGWHADQTPDGRRTWTHPRTGLAVTTIPTTWRPPATGPPANHPGQPRGPDARPRRADGRPHAPDRWPADPTCPF